MQLTCLLLSPNCLVQAEEQHRHPGTHSAAAKRAQDINKKEFSQKHELFFVGSVTVVFQSHFHPSVHTKVLSPLVAYSPPWLQNHTHSPPLCPLPWWLKQNKMRLWNIWEEDLPTPELRPSHQLQYNAFWHCVYVAQVYSNSIMSIGEYWSQMDDCGRLSQGKKKKSKERNVMMTDEAYIKGSITRHRPPHFFLSFFF